MVVDGDVTGNGGAAVYINGSLTLWVNGNITMLGGFVMGAGYQDPRNLTIYDTKQNSSITLGGSSTVYAHIMAPLSDVSFRGTNDFYGWVVGKTVDLGGTPAVHYDGTRGDIAGALKSALVK
jgi:hypothetical protein